MHIRSAMHKFTLMVLFLLAACSEQRHLATIPLYEGCVAYADRVPKLFRSAGYDISLEKELFHDAVPRLPGLIGSLRIHGNLNADDTEMVVNEFRECLPQEAIRMKVEDVGRLPANLKEFRGKASEQYVTIDDSKIRIYQRVERD